MSFEEDELQATFVELFGLDWPLEPLVDPEVSLWSVECPGLVDANGKRGRVLGPADSGGALIVETCDGLRLAVPASNLRAVEVPRPQDGGFDVAWFPGEEEPDGFAEDVAELLRRRGWCLLHLFTPSAVRQAAVAEALDLVDWRLPSEELEALYLGHGNRTKVSDLEGYGECECDDALSECDRALTQLGLLLAPVAPDALGFELWGRHAGQVRMPFKPSEERYLRQSGLAEHDYQAGGKVSRHLNFLERRKLLGLYVLDGAGGELVLHSAGENPTVGGAVHLPLSAGQLVVLLPEVVTYSYEPGTDRSLLLQTWYVTEPSAFDAGGPQLVEILPTQQHERLHVTAMHFRFPGEVKNTEDGWHMWMAGTDCSGTLPTTRFDLDGYYSPDGNSLMYTDHFAGISEEVVMGFDYRFFNMSFEDGQALGPGQRNQLEVGYELLVRAGYNRASLKGLHCGVYVGDGGTDWKVCGALPTVVHGIGAGRTPNPNIYAGWQIGMGSSRLSHLLDMKGPCLSVDTACSSSLVALGQASRTMAAAQAHQAAPSVGCNIDKAVVMGLCLDDGVATFVAYCMATMLSPNGRSFTFDESANGFLRGEGCGGLFLHLSDSDLEAQEMLACVVGSNVNQDGRSASMTAPHGPSQQMCIRASMAEAGLRASDITIAECHGTGTALGDPIEIGALREVMKDRTGPAIVTSSKSNFGHMEACAGMGGIGKCVLMLSSTVGACNLHLRSLNPHIDYTGFPAIFVLEHTDLRLRSGIAGVSSFGVGGTNARGDLWARCTQGHFATREILTAERKSLRSAAFRQALNDEGALVAPGSAWSHKHLFYCGRRLGREAVPGSSDGRCGPAKGPQCASCARYTEALEAMKAAAGRPFEGE